MRGLGPCPVMSASQLNSVGGGSYRVSPLSPPLASCDPAPVADMTKRVPKRTCARRAHCAATQRTHPALIKRTPSLASAMCVAHRKAPLAFLCSPAVSVLGRGTRIPERDLCARLHSGSVNRDQSQYGESQEAEASPRPPWTRPPRRRGRHASEARCRSRRRALAPCRRHVLPQAAGGCQVLAPPLVVPAVTGATLPQAAVLESIAAGWCCWTSSWMGGCVGSDCRLAG